MALIIVAFGISIITSAIAELYYWNQLSSNWLETRAKVTEWEIDSFRSSDYYEVRYTFTINGKSYSASNIFGGTNELVTIPKETWEASRGSSAITVIYSPSNPWNNRPKESELFASSLFIMIICGLCLCFVPLFLMYTEEK